jgi:hypothetical protein
VFASDETIEGGPGEDTVDYGGRVPGVAVDTDGVPDDGAIDPITIGGQTVAEHDNVQPDVEHVIAGAGNDRLMAAWMSGGGGDDVLMDRAGAQRFSGGAGDDTATYADRNQAITADPDGIVGDDGAAGEGDTIDTDVENLHGGAGTISCAPEAAARSSSAPPATICCRAGPAMTRWTAVRATT